MSQLNKQSSSTVRSALSRIGSTCFPRITWPRRESTPGERWRRRDEQGPESRYLSASACLVNRRIGDTFSKATCKPRRVQFLPEGLAAKRSFQGGRIPRQPVHTVVVFLRALIGQAVAVPTPESSLAWGEIELADPPSTRTPSRCIASTSRTCGQSSTCEPRCPTVATQLGSFPQ